MCVAWHVEIAVLHAVSVVVVYNDYVNCVACCVVTVVYAMCGVVALCCLFDVVVINVVVVHRENADCDVADVNDVTVSVHDDNVIVIGCVVDVFVMLRLLVWVMMLLC